MTDFVEDINTDKTNFHCEDFLNIASSSEHKNKILITPIGGLEQIGGNCMLVGLNDEYIMIDMGISFWGQYGIDIILPDIRIPAYVKDKIKGLFITHAHEDHIGAVQHCWPQVKCPIYVTEFSHSVLRQRISSHHWFDEVPVHKVDVGEVVDLGNMKIEFVRMSHSILGACGIYVKTDHGSIFHTGDWKIDKDPLIGDKTDEKRIIEIGKEGVDCLLCDSTNIHASSKITSESEVSAGLKRVIEQYSDKRISVTCFASNLARIAAILKIAKENNRKVAVVGHSMNRMLEAIESTSYYTDDFKQILSGVIDIEEAVDLPHEQVLILCTGSQGETRASLSKISRGANSILKYDDRDVIIFSSKVIPGNELDIRDLQNQLVKMGAKVVTTETEKDIHVSGHPDKDNISTLYSWLKPNAVIPIHGDAIMIYAHRDFATQCGIKNVLISESGDTIELSKGGALKKINHAHIVPNIIDGEDIIPQNHFVVRERSYMSVSGHVSISVVLSENYLIQSIIYTVSGIYLEKKRKEKIDKLIKSAVRNNLYQYVNNKKRAYFAVESAVERLMIQHMKKRPVVSVHIHSS